MPGFAHFELVELIHDDVAKTWLAREPGSGRLLLLHKFSRASGLREKLRAMSPPDQGILIKAGEESGLFYVVTQDTPELRQFRRWVESRSKVKSASIYPPSVNHSDPEKTGLWRPPGGAPSEAAPENPAPKEAGPGEFTQMFQTPPAKAPSAEPATFTGMFESAAPRASNAPAAKEPAAGEFTQMFQTLSGEPQSPVASNSSLPAEKSSSPVRTATAPGEFTQMFQTPPAGPSPRQTPEARPQTADPDNIPTAEMPPFKEAPPQPTEPPAAPGEFTRIFNQPQTAARDSAPVKKPDQGGEFTRMFGSPDLTPTVTETRPTQPEPPAKPAVSGPGDFTREFQKPSTGGPPSNSWAPGGQLTGAFQQQSASNPAPAPPAAPIPNNPAPGEFTRIFSPAAAPTPPADDWGPVPRSPSSDAAPAPPPSSGPGEFTRIIQAPVQGSAAPSVAAPAAPASPSAAPTMKLEVKAPTPPAGVVVPKNYIALVIVLAVLAVVAIALILYFALRR